MPQAKSQMIEDLEQGIESLLTHYSYDELYQAMISVAWKKAQVAKGDAKLYWICQWAALRLAKNPDFSVALDLYEAEVKRES